MAFRINMERMTCSAAEHRLYTLRHAKPLMSSVSVGPVFIHDSAVRNKVYRQLPLGSGDSSVVRAPDS